MYKRLRYFLENLLSKGVFSQIFFLSVISTLIILFGTSLIYFLSPTEYAPSTFLELCYWLFVRLIDPGTFVEDKGFFLRFVTVFVTFTGIFVFSILLGLIVSQIQRLIEKLKLGKTDVPEKNHYIILGWSPKIFSLLIELSQAHIHHKIPVIVILTNKKKAHLEEEISRECKNIRARIVIRNGNTSDILILSKLGINEAKSIMIFDDPDDLDDVKTIKSALIIIKNPNRKKEAYNIVVESNNPDSKELLEGFHLDEIKVVIGNQIMSRLLVQTVRFPALSNIVNELFSFKGNEFYVVKNNAPINTKFIDLIDKFVKGIPVGVLRENGKKEYIINPDHNLEVQVGDKIILLAQSYDDASYFDANLTCLDKDAKSQIIEDFQKKSKKELIIIGYNEKLSFIIDELYKYYNDTNIAISVFVNGGSYKEDTRIIELKNKYPKIYITFFTEINQELLTDMELNENKKLIILIDDSNFDKAGYEDIDTYTMLIILKIRKILHEIGDSEEFDFISELLSIRNRTFADILNVNNYFISHQLLSMYFSHLLLDRLASDFIENVFSPGGNDIYIVPVKKYINKDKIRFGDLLKYSCYRKEIVLGIIDTNNEVHLNPNNNEMINFKEDDQIIVLINTNQKR
jgi:ion channel POLLUX/CASTOR